MLYIRWLSLFIDLFYCKFLLTLPPPPRVGSRLLFFHTTPKGVMDNTRIYKFEPKKIYLTFFIAPICMIAHNAPVCSALWCNPPPPPPHTHTGTILIQALGSLQHFKYRVSLLFTIKLILIQETFIVSCILSISSIPFTFIFYIFFSLSYILFNFLVTPFYGLFSENCLLDFL